MQIDSSENRIMKIQLMPPRRQQGIALVIFAIGLVAIIGIAGLALDLSYAMLNDARLQNAMDACALSGAQVLMDTEDTTLASDAAKATFDKNLGGLDQDDWADVVVDFSDTLEPFNPGGSRYARCEVGDYSITTRLAKILGIGQLGLSVTAVAGPIPITNCNVAPLMVCGDTNETCDFGDDYCYGFTVYKENEQGNPTTPEEKCYLKACAPGKPCAQQPPVGENCGAQAGAPLGGGSGDPGPGNFQFLDMECTSGKSGKNCIKQVFEEGGSALINSCVNDGGVVVSETGNAVSTIPSFNTMFDGPNADTVTGDMLYSNYIDAGGLKADGGNERRVLPIVIADCETPPDAPGCKGKFAGKSCYTVMTTGCFFATEKAVKKGNESEIWGEFIGRCAGTGNLTTTPNAFDIHKIVLYKDYQGPDS
jgi:hypothetical protein